MDITFKQRFTELWNRYFPCADLPIAFYYTDEEGRADSAPLPKGFRCIICDLVRVRNGKSLYFNVDTVGCFGGKKYLGFVQDLRPNFEYFLSYGIPEKLEGERYKKSPELVKEVLKHQPPFKSPGKYIVFKRWDMLDEDDEPAVVVFFAVADVLSGLFTLANFDESNPLSVIAPSASSCASIVSYPYIELDSQNPKAVLGMFDVSARPCVPAEVMTFAIPWPKFVCMVDNMEQSFLITESWNKVRTRIQQQMKGETV